MTLLRGIYAIVLLSALGEIDTDHRPDSDVHAISSKSDRPARGLMEPYPGETLASLAAFECARWMPQIDTGAGFAAWTYRPAGEADQERILLSLVKGVLRSVTGYVRGAGYQVPTSLMLIGIRG